VGDANMMWHCRHSFSEVLELKTGEQVVIVAIEVWGARALACRFRRLAEMLLLFN